MRRQVVLLVTATTLLVLLAFLLPLALLLRTLASDRAVAEATKEAQSIAVLVAVAETPQLQSVLTLTNQRSVRRVGLVLADGTTLGPPDPGSTTSLALAKAGRSFTAAVPGGREIYVPVDTAAGRAVVRSFVPNRLLTRGVAQAVSILIALGGALLVLTVLVADRMAAGTVRPMRELEAAARALADGGLDTRVAEGGPTEVREVGHAFNVLARRIGELLVAEREAVADLSHRLRTPLTTLRLDAEARHDEQLVEHVDALERTVDEVIREARRPVREGIQIACDAGEVVHERAAFWAVLMEDQGRPFPLEVEDGTHLVRLAPDDLGAAVDALLQNVLRHTEEGVAVQVSVRAGSEGTTRVTVSDEGPGFAHGALSRGRSTAGSTGLGLDIARRTAEASGGCLELGGSESGGAQVTLVLGPAP